MLVPNAWWPIVAARHSQRTAKHFTWAILFFERASDCTNTLYFGELYKYFCTPWFRVCLDRVLNFFQILTGVHRIHGCEKHWLPVPFETSSSWKQSTLDDGVHVASVPGVADVREGEVEVLGTRLSGSAHGCCLLNLKEGEEQKEMLEAKDDEEKASEVDWEVEERERERVNQRVHGTWRMRHKRESWATVWCARNQTKTTLKRHYKTNRQGALTNLHVLYSCVFTCFRFASTLNMLLCLLFCFVSLIQSSSVFPRIHFSPVCEFLIIPCNCSHCENGSFEVLSLHLHHLLDELYHHVATIWSWILTLQNNLDWFFLDQRPSIFVHDKE